MVKRLVLALVVLCAILLPMASAGAVPVLDPVCENIPAGDSSSICTDNQNAQNSSDDLLFGKQGILTRAVTIFSIVVAVSAIIVILIAAVRFITSNGDTNTVNSSRNWILYAIVGLVVAGLAQSIVIFVLTKIGG